MSNSRQQEVRKEVDKLSKTLASHEKEEVKFQEKKKHAVTKQKKIKKSLSEVMSTWWTITNESNCAVFYTGRSCEK
jgi:hypothetical protein